MKDMPYIQIRSRSESEFDTDNFHRSIRPAIFIIGVLVGVLMGM